MTLTAPKNTSWCKIHNLLYNWSWSELQPSFYEESEQNEAFRGQTSPERADAGGSWLILFKESVRRSLIHIPAHLECTIVMLCSFISSDEVSTNAQYQTNSTRSLKEQFSRKWKLYCDNKLKCELKFKCIIWRRTLKSFPQFVINRRNEHTDGELSSHFHSIVNFSFKDITAAPHELTFNLWLSPHTSRAY